MNILNYLKRLNAKVILCLDNDKAGEKSTLANGEALIKNNLEVMVVRLSGEKDPDSYILKYGVGAYKDAINSAITYFDFKNELA
ncbi:MAG: toprim domain-containing protein [Clostridium sp.]|nr:MAG: toprim domain-containing protein [Clostridium sp.]